MSQITVFLRHAKRSHASDLDLSNRQLSFLPKELLTMRNVERLNLSNNKLQYLEHSISELYKLKELNLSNNLLTEIPQEVASLPKLSVLNVEGNPLSPKFEHLLLQQNQTSPNLESALRQCFENQPKSKTPQWLIDSNTKELVEKKNEIMWDQKIFKVQRKMSRRADRVPLVHKEPQSVFKNGVLEIKQSDLSIGEQFSMGGFSTIHKGKFCGLEVCAKKVFNPNISEELLNQFHNQIAMLSKYRHPNIVLLMGAITTPPHLCIVMEYCREGTLYDLLHRKKVPLLEQDKKNITTQILLALQYLHMHGIIHRDIKSHNILINSHMQAKLCDFGLARHKSELNTGPMQFCGTPTYMAQELFLKKSYDESVDIFALGTMLYELYSGDIPYHGIDPADIQKKVLKDGSLQHKIGMKKSISEMINRCRNEDVSSRPSIGELLDFEDW